MSLCELEDLTINYTIVGEGSALVLLTGMMCRHESYWTQLLPHLKDYKIIMLDNRYSGKSIPKETSNTTIELMVDDLYKLLSHLNIEKAHLFGHSLGALIALSFGHKYPGIAEKIISTNGFSKLPKKASLVFEQVENLLGKLPSEDAMATLLPWLYSNEFLSDNKSLLKVREFLKKEKVSLKGYIKQRGAMEQFDATKWLKDIRSDTLVIGSSEDILITQEESYTISEEVPHSSLALVNCGHSSIIEKPLDIAGLIKDFL